MKFKIVGIGEVLWDLLPGGRQVGGAPANFAYHANALGADARVISRVGHDEQGCELISSLEKIGLPTDCVEVDPVSPTGTVTVQLASNGEPHFTIHEGAAWDHIAGEEPGRRAVAVADAVCFGTLAQRHEQSRASIRTLLRATPSPALRILDVNLRQRYYTLPIIEESLELANVLKVNETELPILAGMLNLPGDTRSQISQFARRYNLRLVAYTRGGHGSLLYACGRWADHPGVPTTVADTVGAGDSFTAAMTLGLRAGWDLDLVNQRANEVAAYVASRSGATPTLPEQVRQPFRS
jgi:fructokinase